MSQSGSSLVYHGSGLTRPNPFSSWDPYVINFFNSFELSSIEHPKSRSPVDDNGGPFFLDKKTYTIRPIETNDLVNQGPIVVTSIGFNSNPDLPDLSPMGIVALAGKGATAIARTEPNRSKSYVFNALFETYHDGLPRVFGSSLKERGDIIHGAGAEYLNYQFGWKPFVSDIRSISNAVVKGHKYLGSYIKQSSYKIRKRYTFPQDEDLGGRTGAANFTNSISPYLGWGSSSTILRGSTWFSGAFRYYVPVGNDTLSVMDRAYSQAKYLLGVKLTPEVIWNSAPWSWAVDWFSNAGDIMRNISDLGSDGLLLQYGYAMHQQELFHTMEGSNFLGTSVVSYYHKMCQRIHATPWGFEFDLSSLTPRQIGIAASIGLTHGSRSWNARS
jgi:hypothetical protein